MTTSGAAPISAAERIGEVDIIRGFALFGVLWMNLYAHPRGLFPSEKYEGLATSVLDPAFSFIGEWLMMGKAQALFSILFGFGFAILTDRAARRGADGSALYLRRLLILFVVGVAHLLLLWTGDILHAYAAMGLGLILTRRLPGWALLLLGVFFCILFQPLAGDVYKAVVPDAWRSHADVMVGFERRWDVFLSADYPAYLRMLAFGAWDELYGQSVGLVFLSLILGRFFIGAWIYRTGWMQDVDAHADAFRKWASILLVVGLALSIIPPAMRGLELRPLPEIRPLYRLVNPTGTVVLALGYGALLAALCQTSAWRTKLSGLGAVGRMALTNYLTQSLVYFFVLYGFGLGWMRWLGPAACLPFALVVFALQIAFSRWWLARFRFGPAEWLWRSATYGRWQPFRLRRIDPEIATAV